MIYLLVFIPVFIAMYIAVVKQCKRKNTIGTALFFILNTLVVVRFSLMALIFGEVEITPWGHRIEFFTSLYIIPFMFMYLADQCGTKWYSRSALAMVLLPALCLLPPPSFELENDLGNITGAYELTIPNAINVYHSGSLVYALKIRHLVVVVQCIIFAVRMVMLSAKIKEYGLKFTRPVKFYAAWMTAMMVVTIVSFLCDSWVRESASGRWAFFAVYTILLAPGYLLVPYSFSIKPIVTEDDEEAVDLDNYIDEQKRVVSLLRTMIDRDKFYLEPTVNIEDVCVNLKTDEKTVNSIMQNAYGQDFNSYLLNARILHSKQLLISSHLSIDEVAKASGFIDFESYSMAFQQTTGMTPMQWKSGQ